MIVSWFSCGAASACATWLAQQTEPDEVVIARCLVANEHSDNDRFASDCERLWFKQPIVNLTNPEYADCWEVWEERRYISGIKGAPCTTEMKKVPRWSFEREHDPVAQVFGFTAEEKYRADRFREQNPEIKLITPLIDAGIKKEDCYLWLKAAGIELPVMYKLGFSNNNCICCAKATSIVYWARCRALFPVQFARMAELSRRFGVRLTRLKGKRIFLDEIPADVDWRKRDRENVECGLLCVSER